MNNSSLCEKAALACGSCLKVSSMWTISRARVSLRLHAPGCKELPRAYGQPAEKNGLGDAKRLKQVGRRRCAQVLSMQSLWLFKVLMRSGVALGWLSGGVADHVDKFVQVDERGEQASRAGVARPGGRPCAHARPPDGAGRTQDVPRVYGQPAEKLRAQRRKCPKLAAQGRCAQVLTTNNFD